MLACALDKLPSVTNYCLSINVLTKNSTNLRVSSSFCVRKRLGILTKGSASVAKVSLGRTLFKIHNGTCEGVEFCAVSLKHNRVLIIGQKEDRSFRCFLCTRVLSIRRSLF